MSELDPNALAGASPAPSTTRAPENPPVEADDDLPDGLDGLHAKNNGDWKAVAKALYGDTFKYREKLRELRRSAPPSGSVVLNTEQAKAWTAYQTLGNPEDLARTVSERTSLNNELTGLKKEAAHSRVAEATGYARDVLATLVERDKIEVDVENVGGKPVAMVKDQAGRGKPLADYAAEHWKSFLPALQSGPSAAKLGTPTVQNGQASQNGVHPTQNAHVVVSPPRRIVRGI